MNADTETRIRTLKNSLECFVCGLLGLLPLVGFPFAVVALVISGKVRVRQKKIPGMRPGLTGFWELCAAPWEFFCGARFGS